MSLVTIPRYLYNVEFCHGEMLKLRYTLRCSLMFLVGAMSHGSSAMFLIPTMHDAVGLVTAFSVP